MRPGSRLAALRDWGQNVGACHAARPAMAWLTIPSHVQPAPRVPTPTVAPSSVPEGRVQPDLMERSAVSTTSELTPSADAT